MILLRSSKLLCALGLLLVAGCSGSGKSSTPPPAARPVTAQVPPVTIARNAPTGTPVMTQFAANGPGRRRRCRRLAAARTSGDEEQPERAQRLGRLQEIHHPKPRKLASLTRGQIGWIISLMVAAIRLGRLLCRTNVSCRASTTLCPSLRRSNGQGRVPGPILYSRPA
jgi:hypothetical protein